MNEQETKLLEKKFQQIIKLLKAKRKLIGRVLISVLLVAFVTAVVVTIQRAKTATELKKENEELKTSLAATQEDFAKVQGELTDAKEELAYSEEQVNLLEESTNALVEQVGKMEKKVSELEALLNVKDTPPQITKKQLEQQLSSLSELVTAKYFYRNATQQEASKTWLWGWEMPFSDVSLLAAYDGTIKAGIDFKEIQVDVNEPKKTITITLPPSKITDNNIPQETINVLEVRNNLFNNVSFNDYNQFISAEKDVMEAKAIEQGVLVEADNEARTTIKAFLSLIPGMSEYTLIVK